MAGPMLPSPAAGRRSLPDVAGLPVAVLGGTGPLGLGLARRLAAAGHPVVLGSRAADRAASAAEPLARLGLPVTGAANRDAADGGEVVVAAVPYAGHLELLAGLAGVLAGRILVDAVNPLGFDSDGAYLLPVPAGSAAEEAAGAAPEARVVAAFHHVSAVLLADPVRVPSLDSDVLVASDDEDAAEVVAALAGRIPGMRGILAGRLRTARALEALTANLIAVNRRYRAHSSLRVTDV